MTTAKVHCQICGRLPEDGTHSVAITVPTTDYRGKALQVPGVHFACRNCRQAIAVAEREQKRKRKEEGKSNADG